MHLLRTTLAAGALALALVPAAPAATLRPFRSEADLARALDGWKAKQLSEAERRRRAMQSVPAPAGMPIPPPPAPTAAPGSDSLDKIVVTGSLLADSAGDDGGSITNNQVQGVDEGDIVKRAGDVLVVLHRGRLFTVRVGGDRLEPVASSNAFGPDVDPSGAWYDEMLVSDGTVAVIGYSYNRGGTEVGLFDLARDGGLRYRATYQLRSDDYYSSRNYASRLVGHTLVFYSPTDLSPWQDWRADMPAFRRWSKDATPESFRRMLPAARIYRGVDDFDGDLTLHTVSVCNLDRTDMACEATAVLAGPGGVFHVAEDAVYVWATGGHTPRGTTRAAVLRLPLDGAAPSMLQAWGSPIDQMAFLQKDGWLNVLVERDGDGDRMWRAEGGAGELALLRVPVNAFGGLDARVSRDRYRLLPDAKGWDWHQRFIGDWLVYGDGASEPHPTVHALRYASTAPVQAFALPHALERIDALGADGVLVGADGRDLVFTGLRLRGDRVALAGDYRRRDAQQGDARTHGFFYRPQDADSGLLGLPILRDGASASVLYLRNRALSLTPLGTLDSSSSAATGEACLASCFDWYGNARPIFLGDRVFALMGYELVEGEIDDGGIHERRRIDFAPGARVAE